MHAVNMHAVNMHAGNSLCSPKYCIDTTTGSKMEEAEQSGVNNKVATSPMTQTMAFLLLSLTAEKQGNNPNLLLLL